jgi:dGTPase
MPEVDRQYTSDDEERLTKGSTAANRDPFEIDKARIIHSGAFRRLQGKTQVLGVGERDFYRTRLTHSLEVAQIARGLCQELPASFQPDRDLVETICLAHDIGHSPFGHSGERVLHKKLNAELMVSLEHKPVAGDSNSQWKEAWQNASDEEKQQLQLGGFGANPQNIRIVALLEPKFANAGLGLTRATLDGLVKYPKQFDWATHNVSKCFYFTDKVLFDWIKMGVKNKDRKPIEGQLADWADQMAYSINDIEDIVRAGLLSFSEVRARSEFISQKATEKFAQARAERGQSDGDAPPVLLSSLAIVERADKMETEFLKPSSIRERKLNLKNWTSSTIKDLKDGCKIVEDDPSEASIRYQHSLYVSAEAEALSILLKTVASVVVFSDPRVKTLEAKGAMVLETLFDLLYADVELLPRDWQEMINSGEFGPKARLICDFLAGMTDKYAYIYHGRLTQPGVGSFYEFV